MGFRIERGLQMKQLSITRGKMPESGIRKLQGLASKIPEAIRLETGEPDFNTPLYICEAAAQASYAGETKYTAVPGYISLRQAILDDVKKSYGIEAGLDEIIVTSGAVMAITTALMAVADPGDEILIPDPSWPVYEMMILSQGFVPVFYNLNPEAGFTPDWSDLEKKVSSKTKAILVNTPSNPTGAVFNEATVRKFMEFAVEHDLYVISDEVYDAIVFEGCHTTLKKFDTDGRVILINAASKKYAMTGWRIGYAIANKDIVASMAQTMITLIGNATSVAQKAYEAAIKGPQDFVETERTSYKTRRDKTYDIFKDAEIKVYYPNGAFYMMVDISATGMTSDDFVIRLLEEEKVSTAPGSTFGKTTANMIRISMATEESRLLEGASRICRFIKNHSKQ